MFWEYSPALRGQGRLFPRQKPIYAAGCRSHRRNRARSRTIQLSRDAPTSHAEDAKARLFDRRVERGGDGKAEEATRVHWIDHAVVPEARAGVVGVSLALILLADRVLERFFRLLRREITAHGGEHARRLLATHDRDARVGPHPQHAWTVRATAHAVVPGAERSAHDHGELRHRRGGHCSHHLRAVLGDAA